MAEEIQNEVRRLAGEKHSRQGSNVRRGSQNGSVYLRNEIVADGLRVTVRKFCRHKVSEAAVAVRKT